ncbi:MAG: HAD hydrolase family protein [Thermoanaerobaculales bacterium]|jgi:3-deoxy-D-manno-octulosonate 8-phosphate phosphatase (KDO 8-P phosphatase)|nr:HAD hydrolase family protein [Thermoanaerobaculales bacterium]
MPSRLPPNIRAKLEPVRLLILDVDGVLTDGTLFYSSDGEVLKNFNARDGLGIRLLLDNGFEVAVITGRSSEAVAVRCADLGLRRELVFLGSRDKDADLDALLHRLGLSDHQFAAIGDDLPDLPMLGRAGFAFCPGDAAPEVAAVCDHVTGKAGGRGAVREAAEILLKAKGKWTALVEGWSAVERGTG